MRNLICVLLLCGCGGKFEVVTEKPKIPSPDFTVTVQAFEVKQDHAISMLTEVKSRVGDLLLRSDDTKKRLESLEAKLIVPTPKSEEVIKSALEPQETAQANQSQSHQPVALSPAVRLFVSTTSACPPCRRLKKAVDDGEFSGFEITYDSGFNGLRGYPAIRFETPKTATGWGVVYGYDDTTIPTLRAMTGGTTAPVTGAIFPVQAANHITSSRTSFRSVSRWLGFNRGQRVTTRQSCSSGRCP